MTRAIVPLLSALLASILLGTSALAATPIDETLDASGADLVDVRNVSGSVTVTGTNGSDVKITGTLSDDVERLDFRRQGSRILVHVILRDENGRRRGFEGTTLEISAPRGMAVDVETVSAGIEIEDMRGDQELTSVSGSIDSTLEEGEITAKTVSGRIRVAGSDGGSRAEVSSVSGRVELEGATGELIAQTVSGSIDIESPRLERGDLKSVSGSIDVDATLTDGGRLRAVTTSGRISLDMRGTAAGRYELSSFSGSIDNCFGPTPERPQFGPPTSTLRFEEGNANARIEANSMSGSISLCRDR